MSVLLTDADTTVAAGRRLADLLREHLEQGRVAEVRNAVLYKKPHTITIPDYSWRTTDKWIDFPWSVHGPIVAVQR